MSITSELIGKLGGSDVDQVPVEGTASGSSGTREVLYTVEVPEGETWMIILHGNLQSDKEGSTSAELYIGDTMMDGSADNGITGVAHVGTGTIDVGMRRDRSYRSDTFIGHVYTVKL